MVETRFDRGVYEDDEEDSSSGGGGGSSDDVNQELNPNTPDPTDNSSDSNSSIIDRDIIAPNRPENNDEDPVSDEERIAPDVPSEGDSVDTDNDGRNDAIVIDTGNSNNSGSSGGSSSGPDRDPGAGLKEIVERNISGQKDFQDLNRQDIQNLQNQDAVISQLTEGAKTNQELLKARESNIKADKLNEKNLQKVRQASSDTKFNLNGENLSRSQALTALNQQDKIIEESMQQNAENVAELKSQRRRRRQTVFDRVRDRRGIERPFTLNNPLDPTNSFDETVELNREGLQDFIENPEQQSIITGVELADKGQRVADRAVENAAELKQDFDQALIEAAPGYRYAPSAQQSLKQGTTPEDIIKSTGRGAVQGTTQLPGLTIATPGAVSRSLDEDTPSLAQGASKGGELFIEELTGQPGEFVAEEAGEEATEKLLASAAGKTAGGSLGIASSVPTPNFRSLSIRTDEPSLLDQALIANTPGNEVLIAQPDRGRTPDFVEDPGPGSNVNVVQPDTGAAPEFDTTGRNIETETTSKPEPETDSTSSNLFDTLDQTISSTPVLDASLSNSQSLSTPESKGLELSESLSISTASATSSAETRAEAIADFKLDSRLDAKPDPRLDTRPTPSGEFDLSLETDEEELELFNFEQKRDAKRSVGADLLELDSSDLTPEEASNPLSLRPL